MKFRAKFFCFILTLAVVSGCGKEAPGSGASTSGGPSSGASAGEPVVGSAGPTPISGPDLDSVGPAQKPYRLVLIVKTRNNPFFDPMIRAFETECKSLGAVGEVQAPPQEGDKELQFSYVETITSTGADAILIAPADSKAIVPALKKAQDKGILVVNIDNRIDAQSAKEQGLDVAGFIGADNELGGKYAGQFVSNALKGGGKVGIIGGLAGADNAEARRRGFEAGLDKKLQLLPIESADWDMDRANQKFAAMLAAHRDLAGVFCANDMMALGAIKAAKQAGRLGKIVIVGFDNIPAVQNYLKARELSATIEQHPDLMGKYGVKMAVGILNGTVPKSREFLVPLEVIAK